MPLGVETRIELGAGLQAVTPNHATLGKRANLADYGRGRRVMSRAKA